MARSIVTIDDLANDEIERVFALADEFLERLPPVEGSQGLRGRLDLADKYILSSLFYEPSTRTRFSFESAMLRLGGNILSSADPMASSAAKGESIADTIRVVQNYADIIVFRHPAEGAARVAADFAEVPIINGGDGGHEHPTQTLCDLYTLRREKGGLEGLNVQLRGDLKHGRTVHSLVCALGRFGANIITSSAPGLELPAHVVRRLERDYDCVAVRPEGLPADADAVYVKRNREDAALPNLPADFLIDVSSKGRSRKDFRKIDIFYVTRLQSERLGQGGGARDYPTVDAKMFKDRRYRDSRILHPLPRVDELDYGMDTDSRAVYFKQAAYGVPVRMALLAGLLGLRDLLGADASPVRSFPAYSRRGGITCPNPFCVTRSESEQAYLVPKFLIIDDAPTLSCVYCEHETTPRCVGRFSSKRSDTDLARWKQIQLGDLIFFEDDREARAAGYRPYAARGGGQPSASGPPRRGLPGPPASR